MGGAMKLLPADVSDEIALALVDEWASLLEQEKYETAFALTDHVPEMRWTPELVEEVVKNYGDALETQRVTLLGEPTDVTQRKEVDRWEPSRDGCFGEIWYDLNIDGYATDLTATFHLFATPDGVSVRLNEIHVM